MTRRFWFFILLLLIAYALPWVVNPGAALTVNAYDLAEWTTLHPASRSAQIPLLAGFLLRLPLVVLVALIALHAPRPALSPGWWLHALLMLALIIAQMPPLEILNAPDDPNYRMQLALTIASTLSAAFSFLKISVQWYMRLGIGLILLGIVSSIAGTLRAIELMQIFSLPAQMGVGGMLMVFVYGVMGVYVALDRRNKAGMQGSD